MQLQQLNMTQHVFRWHTLTQHAMFLEYTKQQHTELPSDCDMQTNFESFYDYTYGLLNHYQQLRQKEPFTEQTDEADALTMHICTVITCSSTRWTRDVSTRKNAEGA